MAQSGEGQNAGETGWREKAGGEEGEHTIVKEGEVPPRLTGGGRRRPGHLFGLSVWRWVVVGGQSGGGAAGRIGTIFLESFVCVGVHTRAECMCVCECS